MRPFFRLTLVLLAAVTFSAHAIDISKYVNVERYTILDSLTVQHEYGSLLSNGQFKALTSETTGTYCIPIEDFEPFTGRPIVNADLFDSYKALNSLPKWRRSRDEFFIGFIPYVIVSTLSGPDPNPVPIILQQPQSQRALLGDFVYFDVDTTLDFAVTYQWKHANKIIPGETYPFLFLFNIKKTDAGIYTVEISAGGKPIKSKPALLKIVLPVAIKTPPKSQAIKSGKNAVVRVAVTGTGPFTYQWFFNGNAIAGANSSFYTIRPVTAATAGFYSVQVNNGPSEAISAAATISVVP